MPWRELHIRFRSQCHHPWDYCSSVAFGRGSFIGTMRQLLMVIVLMILSKIFSKAISVKSSSSMYAVCARFTKSSSTRGCKFLRLQHYHESLSELCSTLNWKNSPWKLSDSLKGAQTSITYLWNHRESLKSLLEENAPMSAVISLWELHTKTQTITFLGNGSDKLPWLYQLPMMGVVKYIIVCSIFQGDHYMKSASWASVTSAEVTGRFKWYVPRTHNLLTTRVLFDLCCIIILNLHTIMNNVCRSNPPTPRIREVSGALVGYWTHLGSW
jgi:hypothetical protein